MDWSRELHAKTRVNLFFVEKIPYKTIMVAFLFFVIGTIFLYLGLFELYQTGSIAESYEKILLGMILFIPGSYHSALAFMACRKVEGWNYDELTTFEDESFHDRDWITLIIKHIKNNSIIKIYKNN